MRRFLTFLFLLSLCASPVEAGGSRSFDGVDDEIDMGDELDIGTGSATACVWTKTTEDANNSWLIGKSQSVATTQPGYKLFQTGSDTGAFTVVDAAITPASCSVSGSTDLDGVWHFVCGTWVGGGTDTARVYVDGVEEDVSSGCSLGSVISSPRAFQFGEANGNTADLDGLIAYGMKFSVNKNAASINNLMWTPMFEAGSIQGFWPMWGASPEQDLANGFTGTVDGPTASSDGPPVVIAAGMN